MRKNIFFHSVPCRRAAFSAARIAAAVTVVICSFLFTCILTADAGCPDTLYLPCGAQVTEAAGFVQLKPDEDGESAQLSILGAVPVKRCALQPVGAGEVVVCGTPFGIRLTTDGIFITETSGVNTASGVVYPGREAGLLAGDAVVTVNGQTVTENRQLLDKIEASGGAALTLGVRRGETLRTLLLTPAFSADDGNWRAGLWIRDSAAGLGTLTFYDPATGCFGGLGHPVSDPDSGLILPLGSGEITAATVTGIVKGLAGLPGELSGSLSIESTGSLLINDLTGVYGRLSRLPSAPGRVVAVAGRAEVTTGEARILCTVEGSQPTAYDIVIEKTNPAAGDGEQDMTIRITDEALLEKTGGIVQGMSGSPIVQNGKLVGAVTHVFINAPYRGYAIFADTMFAGATAAADLQKAA